MQNSTPKRRRSLQRKPMLGPLRLLLVAASIWGASLSSAHAKEGVLALTVGYRERIAPPPDAVLEVALLDVSQAGEAATRLAMQRFKLTGVPMSVTLRYDPELIDDGQSYGISAEILSGEVARFKTTTPHPALTQDAPDQIELMLTKVSQDNSDPEGSGSLTDRTWDIVEIAGQEVSVENPPTLSFDGDARFGLYSGCNTYAGAAEIGPPEDGVGALSLPEDFAGTLMLCPDEREALQRDVLAAFSTVSAYMLEDDRLTLKTESGEIAVRLRAQSE